MGKMLPMNDALAGQYGTRPRQHLADGGFAKLDDIEALAQNGVETFVPVPKPRNADRDRHAPQPSDPPGVADCGETVWAVTTPRRSTRCGPRPRSAPTPKHVIAG